MRVTLQLTLDVGDNPHADARAYFLAHYDESTRFFPHPDEAAPVSEQETALLLAVEAVVIDRLDEPTVSDWVVVRSFVSRDDA